MMEFTYTRVLSVVLVGFFFIFFSMAEGLRVIPDTNNAQGSSRDQDQDFADDGLLGGIYATGSSLPDCTHACGPCSPCRRVMVSFKCSVGESCPIVYRCMCRGRYYHVPSN